MNLRLNDLKDIFEKIVLFNFLEMSSSKVVRLEEVEHGEDAGSDGASLISFTRKTSISGASSVGNSRLSSAVIKSKN